MSAGFVGTGWPPCGLIALAAARGSRVGRNTRGLLHLGMRVVTPKRLENLNRVGRGGLWLVVGLALLGLAAGLAGGMRVAAVYEATSRVQPIAYTQPGASVSFDTFDKYAQQFVPLIRDPAVMQAVIEQLDLSDSATSLAARVSVSPDQVYIEQLDVS